MIYFSANLAVVSTIQNYRIWKEQIRKCSSWDKDIQFFDSSPILILAKYFQMWSKTKEISLTNGRK